MQLSAVALLLCKVYHMNLARHMTFTEIGPYYEVSRIVFSSSLD